MVRRGSGEQAALYIRRLIFDGRLRPGMRVPQDEVARALGVSRIPVREALVALEREGWVTAHLHRGAFINALDADAIQDHYEIYGTLYGLAVRRAVTREQPELPDRLSRIAAAMSRTDDPAKIQQLAIEFHGTIVDAARSPRIKVVLRAMSALVPGDFFELVPDAVGPERKGLTSIARAVRAGDGERAAHEYGTMMRRQGGLVVRLFRERGLLGDRVHHQP